MLQTRIQRSRPSRHHLHVGLAHTEHEILEAQRLRYQVFGEELGARLPSRDEGIDRDIFDPHCDHLIVRDENTAQVVGTYRLLPPEAARKVGSYYSDTEFDLTRLQHLRRRMVEVGRSCIHPDYRSGAVIQLLWGGIARYMSQGGYTHLIGCASIGMQDGGHAAASLYRQLENHLAPPEYRVFPRCALPLEKLNDQVAAEMPPLIKGYLRAGSYVCGAPAWDADFNTADLLILLPLVKVEGRYARHFLHSDAQ